MILLIYRNIFLINYIKQVVVKVLAAGVNPVETYLRAGTNNYTVKVSPIRNYIRTYIYGTNIDHI